MAMYIRKAVEAVQWTGDNKDEIKELCGSKATFITIENSGEETKTELHLDDQTFSYGKAKIGEYIVKYHTGMLDRYDEEEFKELYIPV